MDEPRRRLGLRETPQSPRLHQLQTEGVALRRMALETLSHRLDRAVAEDQARRRTRLAKRSAMLERAIRDPLRRCRRRADRAGLRLERARARLVERLAREAVASLLKPPPGAILPFGEDALTPDDLALVDAWPGDRPRPVRVAARRAERAFIAYLRALPGVESVRDRSREARFGPVDVQARMTDGRLLSFDVKNSARYGVEGYRIQDAARTRTKDIVFIGARAPILGVNVAMLGQLSASDLEDMRRVAQGLDHVHLAYDSVDSVMAEKIASPWLFSFGGEALPDPFASERARLRTSAARLARSSVDTGGPLPAVRRIAGVGRWLLGELAGRACGEDVVAELHGFFLQRMARLGLPRLRLYQLHLITLEHFVAHVRERRPGAPAYRRAFIPADPRLPAGCWDATRSYEHLVDGLEAVAGSARDLPEIERITVRASGAVVANTHKQADHAFFPRRTLLTGCGRCGRSLRFGREPSNKGGFLVCPCEVPPRRSTSVDHAARDGWTANPPPARPSPPA